MKAAREADVAAYLVKGCTAGELLATVGAVVEESQRRNKTGSGQNGSILERGRFSMNLSNWRHIVAPSSSALAGVASPVSELPGFDRAVSTAVIGSHGHGRALSTRPLSTSCLLPTCSVPTCLQTQPSACASTPCSSPMMPLRRAASWSSCSRKHPTSSAWPPSATRTRPWPRRPGPVPTSPSSTS